MMKKIKYIISSITSLLLGIFIILLFSNIPFIRGFLGDIIVIIFIYSVIIIFFDIKPIKLGLSVLLFAYTLEFLQYFHLIELLGLKKNIIAQIILGSTFDIYDLLAYTIGFFFVYIWEIKLAKGKIMEKILRK